MVKGGGERGWGRGGDREEGERDRDRDREGEEKRERGKRAGPTFLLFLFLPSVCFLDDFSFSLSLWPFFLFLGGFALCPQLSLLLLFPAPSLPERSTPSHDSNACTDRSAASKFPRVDMLRGSFLFSCLATRLSDANSVPYGRPGPLVLVLQYSTRYWYRYPRYLVQLKSICVILNT